MADLITLQQLKDAIGESTTASDDRLEQAITNASVAIRSYTGRAFGSAAAPATVAYAYDGSGWLAIDDASVVTLVTLDGMTLVENTHFVLGPDRGRITPDAPTIYEWIEFPPGPGISPEMGFERNLDTLYGKYLQYHTVEVTATFGWPDVPEDVEQAAIWTAEAFAVSPQPFVSQQIAGYSVQQPSNVAYAIPTRAKELLFPYKRWNF